MNEPEYRDLRSDEHVLAGDQFEIKSGVWRNASRRNEPPATGVRYRRRVEPQALVPSDHEYVVFHTLGDNPWFVLSLHDGECLCWTEHYHKAMKFPAVLVDSWTVVLSASTDKPIKCHNTKYAFVGGGYGGNAG